MKPLAIFLFFLGILAAGAAIEKKGTTYYVNPQKGNDSNPGDVKSHPFRTLRKLKDIDIKAGDRVLLAAGQLFSDPLVLKEVNGTATAPIIISTYGGEEHAKVHTEGALNALLIENSSFVEVSNLSLSAKQGMNAPVSNKKEMRCGGLIIITNPVNYQHIYLSNLKVQDVFYEAEGFVRPQGEVKTANGTQNYGWGIRVINNVEGATIRDLKIEHCTVINVAHTGIKLTSKTRDEGYGIVDFQISGNTVTQVGGPGIQMSGVQNGHIFGNRVDRSGSADDSRKWGRGSGLWTWGSDKVLIEKNRFTNANGPGDSAGAHIDFNCSNIVMQYNFSANNAGGFCEILGNNYNCAYRYNISVNDGYRIKGENGAFQEGKFFWLSGYCKGERRGPYHSYFYNNTIYIKEEIQAKIAIDRVANGVLIANNIFHVEGETKIVKGDQYNPETLGKWMVEDVIFEHNLFLKKDSWPDYRNLKDQLPTFGDVTFKNPGGMRLEHYIPENGLLTVDKGIEIPMLATDTIGLIYGLKVEVDILGNEIEGLPDIGAIEIQ